MFYLSDDMLMLARSDLLTSVLNIITDTFIRQMLLFLEVVCAIFGYMLITFRYGANSQFCQPTVYWATTALVSTVVILIVFTGLAFVCSVLVALSTKSPWLRDFMDSFYDAGVLAKIRRMERRERDEDRAEKARKQQESCEEEFDAWQHTQEDVTQAIKASQEELAANRRYQEALRAMGPAPLPDSQPQLTTAPTYGPQESSAPTPSPGMAPIQFLAHQDTIPGSAISIAPTQDFPSAAYANSSRDFDQLRPMPFDSFAQSNFSESMPAHAFGSEGFAKPFGGARPQHILARVPPSPHADLVL